MSDTSNFPPAQSYSTAAPTLPSQALEGVRWRRIMAVIIDVVLISLLTMLIWFALGAITLGIAWFFVPPLLPIIAFFYNGLTVSGSKRGTPGMRMMDLEVRTIDGGQVHFLNAAVHAVLYWLTITIFAPLLLWSLIAGDKRCLHDLLAGVIVVRRPY